MRQFSAFFGLGKMGVYIAPCCCGLFLLLIDIASAGFTAYVGIHKRQAPSRVKSIKAKMDQQNSL